LIKKSLHDKLINLPLNWERRAILEGHHSLILKH